MFGKRHANIKQMGEALNNWVCKSVKQLLFNDQESVVLGLKNDDDVFYELNSAFLFIVIDIITKSGFSSKQNIIDEMHNQNIEVLIKAKYIASNELIDYRRCLSETYKENSKILKKDNWMRELSKAILVRTEGLYENEMAVSILAGHIESFYTSTLKLFKNYEVRRY